jgi:hypothetical protein
MQILNYNYVKNQKEQCFSLHTITLRVIIPVIIRYRRVAVAKYGSRIPVTGFFSTVDARIANSGRGRFLLNKKFHCFPLN